MFVRKEKALAKDKAVPRLLPATKPCPSFGSLLGPVVPSFSALFGHLKFTALRHKSNKDSLPSADPRSTGAPRT